MSGCRRLGKLGMLLLSAGLSVSLGCQTWIAGMTLPSPDYLTDNPDYIPQGPNFPLEKELAAQQAAARNILPPEQIPQGPIVPAPQPPPILPP